MNCVIIQQIAIQKNLDDAIISNILGCLDIRQKYDKIFDFRKYLKDGDEYTNKELYELLISGSYINEFNIITCRLRDTDKIERQIQLTVYHNKQTKHLFNGSDIYYHLEREQNGRLIFTTEDGEVDEIDSFEERDFYPSVNINYLLGNCGNFNIEYHIRKCLKNSRDTYKCFFNKIEFITDKDYLFDSVTDYNNDYVEYEDDD